MIEINLLPGKRGGGFNRKEKLFCALIGGIFILYAVSFYAYGFYKVKTLKEEIKKEEVAYALLADTIERKKVMENIEAAIRAKNGILAKQAETNVSVYAFLVHLGSLRAEGVTLEEIAPDRGGLLIKGQAASYAQATAFIKKCKEDPFFWQCKAVRCWIRR